MIELIAVYDPGTGAIALDGKGREVWLSESVIRLGLSQRRYRVVRGRGGYRRVFLSECAVESVEKGLRRVPAPQKYCVPEVVGDIYRVFRHVAHRCSGAAPWAPPIDPHAL
jgi:hypothetical protein